MSYATNESDSVLASVAPELLSRFLLNLPETERTDPNRRFYNLELAFWFYIDHQSGLASAEVRRLAQSTDAFVDFASQLLSIGLVLIKEADKQKLLGWDKCDVERDVVRAAYTSYIHDYKHQIPVAGCVIFAHPSTLESSDRKYNCDCDCGGWYVLMIRAVTTPNFGFPKGKVNRGESLMEAAVRETSEEVGYTVRHPPLSEAEGWSIGKATFFPIVEHIPMDFPFRPKTRGEIDSVCWIPVVPLPKLATHGIRLTNMAAAAWPHVVRHAIHLAAGKDFNKAAIHLAAVKIKH